MRSNTSRKVVVAFMFVACLWTALPALAAPAAGWAGPISSLLSSVGGWLEHLCSFLVEGHFSAKTSSSNPTVPGYSGGGMGVLINPDGVS